MSSKTHKTNTNRIPAIRITKYLELRHFFKNAPGKINGNGDMFIFNGKYWMPKKEFDTLYQVPTVIKFNNTDNNPDRTKSFIHHKKQ